MFGYLDINKDTLGDGQRGLWQTFMCGLCMSTKRDYGNFPRAFITNDINFFNVLFHSVVQADVEIENKTCFSHPLKKRAILKTNGLTDLLASANVLLTYWNVYDDVLDGTGFAKRTVLKSLKKSYADAKLKLPLMDEMLSKMYAELQSMEKSGCNSIDKVAHSFASLSKQFCDQILADNATEYVQTLCYNLGKWIYLIDALDDVSKDIKSNNYNVFVRCYSLMRAKDIKEYCGDIKFLMYTTLNRIAQAFNDLNLTKYTCILQNVLFEGIRNKTERILKKSAELS